MRVRPLLRVLAIALLSAGLVVGDVTQKAYDERRTSWFKNELSGISKSDIQSFSLQRQVQVPGQVYAQLLAYKNKIFAASEKNYVIAFDAITLDTLWQVQLGTPIPASQTSCNDLAPWIGITGTPVIDPSTDTMYVLSKELRTPGTSNHVYRLHALDVTTGAERRNFPVEISGNANNAPSLAFNVKNHNQRPGLLLMDGVVYSAYASYCDVGDYQGWIIGVSILDARVTTLWTSMPSGGKGMAGIWMSGAGIMSDRPGDLVVTTGNGNVPPLNSNGNSGNSLQLGMSIVRLRVGSDGHLSLVDFFTPANSVADSSTDQDFGNNGAVASPPGLTRPVILTTGKLGDYYIADANNLGGNTGQNRGFQVAAASGQYSFSTPSMWGPASDGSTYYAYFLKSNNPIDAYSCTTDRSGNLVRTLAGRTLANTGGGGTTTAIITGTNSTNTVLWNVNMNSRNGASARLVAYDAVPQMINGQPRMQTLWSAALPSNALKFNSPIASYDRLYAVGLSGPEDSVVFAYGLPPNSEPSTYSPTPRPATPTPTTTSSRSPSAATHTSTQLPTHTLTLTRSAATHTGTPTASVTPTRSTSSVLASSLPTRSTSPSAATIPPPPSPTAIASPSASADLPTTPPPPSPSPFTSPSRLPTPSSSTLLTHLPTSTSRASTPTPSRLSTPTPGTSTTQTGTLLCIDAGASSDITLSTSSVCRADNSYRNGRKTSFGSKPVSGVQGGALRILQTVREGSAFSYRIPVPWLGKYTVTLDFVELYWTSSNKRVFSVALQGTLILSNLDIVASVGAGSLLRRTFDTAAMTSPPSISLLFVSSVDWATVAAIRISGPLPSQPAPTPEPWLYRVNCGSSLPVLDLSTGTAWNDDEYFSGGVSGSQGGAVTNVPASSRIVYMTERYGTTFTYTIPVPFAGVYDVILNLNEIYWTLAGYRRFSVAIQNVPALTDFDTFKAAGGKNIVIRRTFAATVRSAPYNIVLTFSTIVGEAAISAIEIAYPSTATATGSSAFEVSLTEQDMRLASSSSSQQTSAAPVTIIVGTCIGAFGLAVVTALVVATIVIRKQKQRRQLPSLERPVATLQKEIRL
mmetsp:Transcript_32417/g.52480  ORF Transcript_32417/g.52480 Transcript_32417/m.52480 type:complete len:1085 (-) Transcript_32417:1020-4274(-)|eukprot:CAMPEP_0184665680 /NCGR_PEP_ID=MMETSP0308-20130426/58198_1 /TAXON_ID=38269 /ORGANISM="Gloeochaete witrockiana, Strain SAG 46.84" /LENGTH=1084 /DNA_ID=CAMNT_0027109821 /DNA_START=220 /DNA_END=3474 /DNA_ORIENTATION=+